MDWYWSNSIQSETIQLVTHKCMALWSLGINVPMVDKAIHMGEKVLWGALNCVDWQMGQFLVNFF